MYAILSITSLTASLTLLSAVKGFKDVAKREMIKIEKFAISKVDDFIVCDICLFPAAEQVWKNALQEGEIGVDLNDISCGLLIKNKIPSGIYGEFLDSYNFPHLLVAECLAARFLLNAVISDLQCTGAVDVSDFGVDMVPVMEFFSDGLLKRWLKREFNIENVIHTQFFHNLYYLWFVKSESDNMYSKLFRVTSLSFFATRSVGRNVSFFANLSKCSNLKELSLKRCEISSESLSLFTRSMTKKEFSHLEVLDFSFNSNIGKEFSFFEALKFCPQVSDLDFMYCELTEQSVQSLEWACSTLRCLKIFCLTGNTDVGNCKEFLEVLKRHPNLRKLYFDNCQLTYDFLQAVATPSKESYSSALEELHLSRNSVVGKECYLLFGLKLCQNLRQLRLFECGIRNEEMESLREQLNVVDVYPLDGTEL